MKGVPDGERQLVEGRAAGETLAGVLLVAGQRDWLELGLGVLVRLELRAFRGEAHAEFELLRRGCGCGLRGLAEPVAPLIHLLAAHPLGDERIDFRRVRRLDQRGRDREPVALQIRHDVKPGFPWRLRWRRPEPHGFPSRLRSLWRAGDGVDHGLRHEIQPAMAEEELVHLPRDASFFGRERPAEARGHLLGESPALFRRSRCLAGLGLGRADPVALQGRADLRHRAFPLPASGGLRGRSQLGEGGEHRRAGVFAIRAHRAGANALPAGGVVIAQLRRVAVGALDGGAEAHAALVALDVEDEAVAEQCLAALPGGNREFGEPRVRGLELGGGERSERHWTGQAASGRQPRQALCHTFLCTLPSAGSGAMNPSRMDGRGTPTLANGGARLYGILPPGTGLTRTLHRHSALPPRSAACGRACRGRHHARIRHRIRRQPACALCGTAVHQGERHPTSPPTMRSWGSRASSS